MLKRHPHSPAHLFIDNTAYFITGAIYQKRHLLAEAELKQALLKIIQENFAAAEWQLQHWVILNNHYHLIGQSRQGKDLTTIVKGIHGRSGSKIRNATQCELPVWWNYWDYCPRNEHQYMTRLNYLLYNPVKHGYVTDLKAYEWSSFHALYSEIGRDRLAQQFREYSEYKSLQIQEAEGDEF